MWLDPWDCRWGVFHKGTKSDSAGSPLQVYLGTYRCSEGGGGGGPRSPPQQAQAWPAKGCITQPLSCSASLIAARKRTFLGPKKGRRSPLSQEIHSWVPSFICKTFFESYAMLCTEGGWTPGLGPWETGNYRAVTLYQHVSQTKSFGCPKSLMTMVINVPYFIGKEIEVQRGWMPCPKCPGAWLPPPHRWLLQMGLGKPEGPRDLCLWSKRSKRFYDEELAFFAIIFSCMHSGVFQKLQDLRSHNKRSWGILVSSADICKNVEQYYSPYYFFILKMFFIRILYATMRCVCCYF